MASEEMVQVLRNHGVFAYGSEEDIERYAEEWEDYDFSPDQADKWLEAGCFQAYAARELSDAGISSENAARLDPDESRPGTQIGYSVANGDMSIEEAVQIIEEVA